MAQSDFKISMRLLLAWCTSQQVELGVGHHAGDVGHTVTQAKECGDARDVPDVFMAKSNMARWRGVMSALR
jgi:hypothetical protein